MFKHFYYHLEQLRKISKDSSVRIFFYSFLKFWSCFHMPQIEKIVSFGREDLLVSLKWSQSALNRFLHSSGALLVDPQGKSFLVHFVFCFGSAKPKWYPKKHLKNKDIPLRRNFGDLTKRPRKFLCASKTVL